MSNYIQVTDDVAGAACDYKIHLEKASLISVKLDPMDQALLDDIDHGKPSSTPIADMLLGLETLVRRIEEQQPTKSNIGETE